MNGWGCGVILISCDWIRHLIPLFSGRWGNCPKFCQKMYWCPHMPRCRTKRCNIWKGENNVSKEGWSFYIFVKNMQISFCPFSRKCGELNVRVSFSFTIVRRWCHRYRVENYVVAAVVHLILLAVMSWTKWTNDPDNRYGTELTPAQHALWTFFVWKPYR